MNTVSQRITIYSCYFLNKMPGTSPELFLRKGVAERIIGVAGRLPSGLTLVLIDGWRSYETQRFIYDTTIEKFRADGYSEEKIKREIKHFVACPSKDRDKPAPHYTGGAIDLTIADSDGWLGMGTGFDDFTERAHLHYFEWQENLSPAECEARDNRRFLAKIMEEAGFVHNPREWWHYSYGDLTWANSKNQQPLYGGIEPGKKYF